MMSLDKTNTPHVFPRLFYLSARLHSTYYRQKFYLHIFEGWKLLRNSVVLEKLNCLYHMQHQLIYRRQAIYKWTNDKFRLISPTTLSIFSPANTVFDRVHLNLHTIEGYNMNPRRKRIPTARIHGRGCSYKEKNLFLSANCLSIVSNSNIPSIIIIIENQK